MTDLNDLPGFTVKLRGKGLAAGRKGHDIVFVWRGQAEDGESAAALAREDAAIAWAANAYGRTGAAPEAPFMALKDGADYDPHGFQDDTLALHWHFKGAAIGKLPNRVRARRLTHGEFGGLVREAAMADPAIRGMALAEIPATATVYATGRPDEEGALVRLYRDVDFGDCAPAPRASRATLRALAALTMMNTHLDEAAHGDVYEPKRHIAAQPELSISSATLRATIAQRGAPNPEMAARLLIGAGLGDLADAIRAQARTAHKEPA